MIDRTQQIIDECWDFDDPSASEIRFLEAIRSSRDAADSLELQTQVARAAGLSEAFVNGHSILDAAEQVLANFEHDSRFATARVRCLLERGRLFNTAGERDQALRLFEQALHAASQIANDHLAVDAAHMIAIVHGASQRHELALEWNRRAMDMASQSSQSRARQWRASLHNNLGWTYHDRGEFEQALEQFEAALRARIEQQAASVNVRIAQWCVARCLRSLNRLEAALAMQLKLERDAGDEDGFVCEEVGECLLALNRAQEARSYFARALSHLSSHPGVSLERINRLRALAG